MSELAFRSVSKIFDQGAVQPYYALREVSFEVSAGQKVAIVGRSGSGKSTLLHLAAGIDVPSHGQVQVSGKDLASLSERDRTLLRRNRIGLIFQFFHLLPHLSVEDNVALPELIAGSPAKAFRPRVQQLLEQVELAHRSRDNIQKLSGGEMQRVAVCRALLRRPNLILADEPTGSLDDRNAGQVMDLIFNLATDEALSLLFVTHSNEMAARADSVWTLHSGILETNGAG